MTIDENHRARVSRNAIPVVLGLIVLAALVAPRPAAAQLETLLSPTLGQVMPRTDYRFTFYPEQDVEGQHTTMSVQEHRWSLTTPIKQDSTNEWTASTSLRYQRNDTRAVLPIANEPFPSELWDVRVGGGYRHQFENGWSGGLSLNAGTASDQPFNSVDELIVRGFAHLRVPWGERDSWIFMLTYSNYSEFLGGVPVPGLAYVYSPSDQFTAVIGLPFAMLEWKPIEQVELQVIYTAIRRIRARATYRPFLPLRIYAGFDWDYDF